MYSYVVKGSEDGIIGVYTSRKAAEHHAKYYIESGLTGLELEKFDVRVSNECEHFISFSMFRKSNDEECYSSTTAEIERFVTNR